MWGDAHLSLSMMMENEGASRELEADLEAVVANDRKKTGGESLKEEKRDYVDSINIVMCHVVVRRLC